MERAIPTRGIGEMKVGILILTVATVALMFGALPRIATAGSNTVTENGNDYYSIGGSYGPSVAYPNGILLSPSYITGGWAAWSIAIDPVPPTYDAYVEVYYTDNSMFGGGPDVLAYNWSGATWDTLAQDTGTGTNVVFDVWIPSADYVSSGGTICVEVYADYLDNTDVGTVGVGYYYDDTPPTNPDSYTAFPQTGVWTNHNVISVQWSGATDDIFGVQGYSIIWSHSAADLPDAVLDTTTNSTTSAALADGVWYLHVRTEDHAGNWNTAAYNIGPFRIDTTPPVTTSFGPSLWSNDSTPSFSWSASDISGVSGYSYSTDNPADDTVDMTGASVTLPTLTDGSHVFYVKARDNAGNWGVASPYSFSLDTVKPTLAISSPSENAAQNVSTVVVDWSGDDSLSGISHYEVQIDAGSPVSVDAGGSSHRFSNVPDGSHVIKVTAIDNALNSVSRTTNVTVDTVVPETYVAFKGTLGSSGWYVSTVRVTMTSVDLTSGVAFTKCSADSSAWTNYSDPFVFSESGVHNFSFYAQDSAGNRNLTGTGSIKIDLQTPSLTFVRLNDGATLTSRSEAISWSSSDNVSGIDHFEYKLDSGTFQSLGATSSVGLTNLASGQHTLTVRAIDKAGNVAEKSVTFKVDTSVVSLSGPVGPWLDIGLVAVALIALLLGLFLVRHPRKGRPKQPSQQEQKPAA
jgi:hypothetical protein